MASLGQFTSQLLQAVHSSDSAVNEASDFFIFFDIDSFQEDSPSFISKRATGQTETHVAHPLHFSRSIVILIG